MTKPSKLKTIFFTAFPFVMFSNYGFISSRYFTDNQHAMQQIALVFFILSGILVGLQIIMREKHYFPPTVFFLFMYITALMYLIPEDSYRQIVAENIFIGPLLGRPGLILYAELFLVALIPPLIGAEPFTYYFAKQGTPEQFWGTKLFKVVNLYINYVWAALFALSFAMQFLPYAWMQIVIPLLVQFIIGFPATKYLQPFLRSRLSYVLQGQPMDYIKTAHDAITGMPYVFNKKNAKDINVVYQFRISGDEEFDGYLEIKKQTCTYHEGLHPSPTITVKSPADVWLKISRKEISGQEAYIKGLFTQEGDLSYVMKIQELFSPEKPGVSTRAAENKPVMGESIFEKKYSKMKPGQIKKVFAIQSSPRKSGTSKTEILTDAFLEGCRQAGAEVEIAYLREKKINHCAGCFTCWTRTPGVCIYKDDVAEIMKKSEEADLIVYASPLYHYGIYSLLKKYIERTLPRQQPYLVAGSNGKTHHPVREGYKDITYTVIIGVCGFPEVSHFGAFSANFHYLANSHGEKGMNIVAEIYRPASEILNNPVYQEETKRVLDAAREAGEQVVVTGTIEKHLIDEIATVKIDINQWRDAANMTWDVCIKEGKTLAQIFGQN